jgi:hypothetical protein
VIESDLDGGIKKAAALESWNSIDSTREMGVPAHARWLVPKFIHIKLRLSE